MPMKILALFLFLLNVLCFLAFSFFYKPNSERPLPHENSEVVSVDSKTAVAKSIHSSSFKELGDIRQENRISVQKPPLPSPKKTDTHASNSGHLTLNSSSQKANDRVSPSVKTNLPCVEIGPIQAGELSHIKQLLGGLPSDAEMMQINKVGVTGPFLVYVPKPTNTTTQSQLVAILKNKQIDFFSTKIAKTEQEVFSLGVFNSPTLAEKFQQQMQTHGLDARLERKQQLDLFIRVLNAPASIASQCAAIRARYPKITINMRCVP